MHLLLPDLTTGTILARPPVFDAEITGAEPGANGRLMAPEGQPQQGRSVVKPKASNLAELLFEATAAAKIWTSHVAMRLERASRDRFFRQLDHLHDIEEWEDDGEPLNLGSYKTFVRSILSLKLDEKPGLALMPSGNLLGIWSKDGSRLSIEFRPGDVVRWVLSEPADGRTDRIAGDTGLERLRAELTLRGSEMWFS